eukprot:TRINITY_DN23165_c0_g1_i1.p1 TRINITY_DN23165_c0_g1~~TRINITY_DN23165_c0_g1_i1.p1  ORF type:complete len:215 (-),score=17.21 TRINITY_DN23165_c0_g1_i1:18-662(-)
MQPSEPPGAAILDLLGRWEASEEQCRLERLQRISLLGPVQVEASAFVHPDAADIHFTPDSLIAVAGAAKAFVSAVVATARERVITDSAVQQSSLQAKSAALANAMKDVPAGSSALSHGESNSAAQRDEKSAAPAAQGTGKHSGNASGASPSSRPAAPETVRAATAALLPHDLAAAAASIAPDVFTRYPGSDTGPDFLGMPWSGDAWASMPPVPS